MPTDPIETARAAKETARLLREARSALRKLDMLVDDTSSHEPPLPHLTVEARDSIRSDRTPS